MSDAKSGDRVRVHYLGRLENGNRFDDSSDMGPVEFEIGKRAFFADFEDAIIGMREGESKTIRVPADRAYGQREMRLIRQVPLEVLGEEPELATGKRIRANYQGRRTGTLTVVEFDDEHVTLDGNHPLAGENLHFDVKLIEIVPAPQLN